MSEYQPTSYPRPDQQEPPAQPAAVVIEDDEPAIPKTGQKPAARKLPKWENAARETVKAGIRRFTRPLNDLVDRDANEGDTRLLVTDFLEHALGYDKYEELTTEYGVKGEFADYGIRIEKELVAFVEVKRVATKLTARHLRQVEMYAVNEGVEWMILTNGVEWRAYHLSGGLPVEIDLASTSISWTTRSQGRRLTSSSTSVASRSGVVRLTNSGRRSVPRRRSRWRAFCSPTPSQTRQSRSFGAQRASVSNLPRSSDCSARL